MSGAGYQDKDKLQAARELAQSFRRGGSSRSSSYGGANRHEQRSRPAPTTTGRDAPPPSQRNYTPSLLENPLNVSEQQPGPILGTTARDFLQRKDNQSNKPEPSPSQQQAIETSVATTQPAVTSPSLNAQPSRTAPIRSEKSEVGKSCMDFLNGGTADRSISRVGGPPSASSVASTLDREPKVPLPTPPPKNANGNIKDEFLSLLMKSRTTLENRSKAMDATINKDTQVSNQAGLPSVASTHQTRSQIGERNASVSVQRSRASSVSHNQCAVHDTPSHTVTKQTSNPHHGAAPKPNGRNRASDSPENITGGKKDDLTTDEVSSLRPQAPDFVAISDQETNDVKPDQTSNLRPQAPRFTPSPEGNGVLPPEIVASLDTAVPLSHHQEISQRENIPPSQGMMMPPPSFSFFLPTGSSTGRIVTVTEVDLANGNLISGDTNGQPWSQMGSAIQPLPAQGTTPVEPRNPVPRQQKPTQGLKGSIWAS